MKSFKKVCIPLFFLATIFFANAQNKPFKVTIEGKGTPVLLFPGFTCTGEVWDNTVSELSKKYECHIFTFAGFGGVTPIEKPWLPKLKEGITSYVEENQLKNVQIIGHSLGGALALWLASENNNFSNIVVVDALPSVGALMMPNFNSNNITYDNPQNKQLLGMNSEAFENMASQMANGMTLNPEGKKQIKEWVLQADRETYVYGYTDLLKLDLRESISKIKIPVTILAATHPYGLETAKKTYKEQYKNLESCKMEFAEGSAHFIMYDRPEWFIEHLSKALK